MPSNKPKKAAGAGQRSSGTRAVPAKPKTAAAEPQLPGYTVIAASEGSTVKPDSKGRILIGEAVRFAVARGLPKPDAYKPVVGEYGEILLIPVSEIPTRELWLHQNPEANASLDRGIQQAREGKYIRGRSFAEHADADLDAEDEK